MELIDRSSLQGTDLINKQNQRGRTPCNRASHNSSGRRRIYRNQRVTSKRATELGEGLLCNRCLQVLRIDERGRECVSIPKNLRLGNKTASSHSEGN